MHKPTGVSQPSLLSRLSQHLHKTRQTLTAGLSRLILGKTPLDANLIESIETALLQADFGLPVTQKLIQDLKLQLSRQQLTDHEQVWQQLQLMLIQLLKPFERPLVLPDTLGKPFVILVVGVNGGGKTTSIGKFAAYFKQQNRKVLLAAGDTFRAAATEQLRVWSTRLSIPLVAQHQGADSASVIYDALQAAQARNYEILMADTAGRLHTESHLIQELQKIIRVLKKLDASAPHEILLVIDATTGQNALKQVTQFQKAVPVSGLAVTKLDGTAKGGILFALTQTVSLPIRFMGTGEGIQDLQVFHAESFVKALFNE
jgi:fused signal recognition particle receptor